MLKHLDEGVGVRWQACRGAAAHINGLRNPNVYVPVGLVQQRVWHFSFFFGFPFHSCHLDRSRQHGEGDS